MSLQDLGSTICSIPIYFVPLSCGNAFPVNECYVEDYFKMLLKSQMA